MKTTKTLLALSLASLLAPDAFGSMNAGSLMSQVFKETNPDAVSSLLQDAQARSVNWAQPPVGCVEEMVPHRADRACPDLSYVRNPNSDWPEMSRDEKAYWWRNRRGIAVCRAEEVLRRERDRPGSQNALHIQLAWMTTDSLNHTETKIKAVYDGARAHGIPLQVLTGALYQESMFAQLGISDDGGNFSCGMQQGNLIGWCSYMNKQTPEVKTAMGWPQEEVKCFYTAEELAQNPNPVKVIDLEFMRPAYELAKRNLKGLPTYRLNKSHFAGVKLEQLTSKWPAADAATNQLRFQVIKSFIRNCDDPRIGILQKANELKTVYDIHVADTGFARKDRYAPGEKFNRQCREEQVGDAYPLHTGWLMVIASYNGGPRAIDAAAFYEGWGLEDLRNPEVVKNYTPIDLVKGLYWGGKYNPTNDLIEFPWLKRPGTTRQWPFFKACVAQRHISRVMQHVTLTPDFFVDTLEGSFGCQRGSFPNGPSGTPAMRQNSSGKK
jgi:hypothetical protein